MQWRLSVGVFAVLAFGSFSAFAVSDQEEILNCSQALRQVQSNWQGLVSGYHSVLGVARENQWLLSARTSNVKDEEAQFILASVSKPLTALMTMRAVDRKLLALDQALNPFLPEEFRTKVEKTWKSVTLEALLHHTSGIFDYINRETNEEQNRINQFLAKERNFSELLSIVPANLRFDPRADLSYSNTNYLFLAKVVESAFNKTYAEVMTQELEIPLNLKGTFVTHDPNGDYYGGSGLALSNMDGVGNTRSSVSDLLKILGALDSPGFLSAESLDLLFKKDPLCDGSPRCGRYGLGWSLRKSVAGIDWVFHEGHLLRTSTLVLKVPAHKLNLVILSDKPSQYFETYSPLWVDLLVKAGCAS